VEVTGDLEQQSFARPQPVQDDQLIEKGQGEPGHVPHVHWPRLLRVHQLERFFAGRGFVGRR
jgi:hypothetical protein